MFYVYILIKRLKCKALDINKTIILDDTIDIWIDDYSIY